MKTKFLHVCSETTLANNDDAAGSVVYPVSSIRSIGMGSMAVTGVISASETVYHIALDPMSISKGAGGACLLYTSPSPRDGLLSRMPSSA